MTTIFLDDNLNVATGVALQTHAPQTGGVWHRHPNYVDDMVGNSGGTGVGIAATKQAFYYNDADPGNDNYKVTVKRDSAPSGTLGAVACADTTVSSWYYAQWSASGQTVALYKRINGTITQLGTSSAGHSSATLNAVGIEVDLANSRVRAFKLDASNAEVELVAWQSVGTPLARGFAGINEYNMNTSSGAGAGSITAEAMAAAATALTDSGPASGNVGAASTNFIVGANGSITNVTTVTPSSNLAGTFTPTSVQISSGSPTATFTFTPSVAGTHSITLANDQALTNPAALSYDAAAVNNAPTFPGPNIADMNLQVGVAMTPVDVSGDFADTDALTFTAAGTWPAGIVISTAGVITGTPTAAGVASALTVVATDTASQAVSSNAFSITTYDQGTLTSSQMKNNTGTYLSNETGMTVSIYDRTTDLLVLRLTGQVTDATGFWTVGDSSIITGTQYDVKYRLASGAMGLEVLMAA